uniref:SDR family NAD(P)-dependent oxidoreductase n=1 Tax=Desertifilum tharense IPPAS B-1220 TaxID=1781255 RepID=A0ACD5GYR2_9CYAN
MRDFSGLDSGFHLKVQPSPTFFPTRNSELGTRNLVMMTTSPVILLTGASSGIGAACALVFAQKISGVRLAIAARSQDKLEALAEKCRSLGAEVLVIPADLGKVEQAEAVAQKTLSHFGQVDVLINNAGYGQMGTVRVNSRRPSPTPV